MKKVCSLFLILVLTLFLSGCGDDDDTDTTTGSGTDTTTTKSTFSKKESYPATGTAWESGRGNGSTFRIPKKGSSYGKTIKIVFSSGYSAVVPDTSKRYSVGKFIYRCGGGSYRNPETWTAHGGAFIVAPENDKSQTVTIYY